jgi:hypothetical protein
VYGQLGPNLSQVARQRGIFMTELEWLLLDNAGDFEAELSLVAQPRKLYLLTAAFYRRVWDLLPNESLRHAVETTEWFASGRAGPRDMLEAWTEAESATGEGWWSEYHYGCPCCEGWLEECFATTIHPNAESLLRSPSMLRAAEKDLAAEAVLSGERAQRRLAEREHQFDILQDIVGDPNERPRPAPEVARDSAEVRRLLAAVADEPCPDALTLLALADALEEAGCDDEPLLRHCRRRVPHVRGCWAIEYLSGRSARVPPAKYDTGSRPRRLRCW